MEKGESHFTIGSFVIYDEKKEGIVCGFSSEGTKTIIYCIDRKCYEERFIENLIVPVYNQEAEYPDNAMAIVRDFYDSFGHSAVPLKNQHIWDFIDHDSFEDGFLNTRFVIFDDTLEKASIATFYKNSHVYNQIVDSNPVYVTSSESSFSHLQCQSISIFPCKALPEQFIPFFYGLSGSSYLVPQMHVFVYSIGSGETQISIQCPFDHSNKESLFFKSTHHRNCSELHNDSHSIMIQLSPFSKKTPISSCYTLAISSSLSILSFFIFIRDSDVVSIWNDQVQQNNPLPMNLNKLYCHPQLTQCRESILQFSSLIYYYLRSPSRVHTVTSVSFNGFEKQVTLYLPYIRSFTSDTESMYEESKYMICDETHYHPTLDDLSSLTMDTPDWNELAGIWTTKGGSFVYASCDSTDTLHTSFVDPITFTSSDHLLFINDELPDLSFFTSLGNASPSLYTTFNPLVPQPTSFAKHCYVIVTSHESLMYIMEYLIHYYREFIPVITLVYYRESSNNDLSDESQQSLNLVTFNNLACVFRPSITPINSPRFFHVDRHPHTFDVDLLSDLSSSCKLAVYEGRQYLCFWNDYIKEDEVFYSKMMALNRLYQVLSECENTILPPLYKVFSGVESNGILLDVYLMGPFPEGMLQPASSKTPETLSQLLQLFDELWSCGYLINFMDWVTINHQPSLYDVSLLHPIANIPVKDRKEYYADCQAQLQSLFPPVTSLPETSITQFYSIHPLQYPLWVVSDTSIKSLLSSTTISNQDWCNNYVFDCVPSTCAMPLYQVLNLPIFNPLLSNSEDDLYDERDSFHSEWDDLASVEDAEEMKRKDDYRYDTITRNMNTLAIESPIPTLASQEPNLPSPRKDPSPVVLSQPSNNRKEATPEAESSSELSDSSDDSSVFDFIVDSKRCFGMTAEEAEGLVFLSDSDESDSDESNESNESYHSVLSHISEISGGVTTRIEEAVNEVFKSSMVVTQKKKEEKKTVLSPLSYNEDEEMGGSRFEQDIPQVEEPELDSELSQYDLRKIPYYGDENEDVKKIIALSALNDSLDFLQNLLSKRVMANEEKGYIHKDNNDLHEVEELPEVYPEPGIRNWYDMGASK